MNLDISKLMNNVTNNENKRPVVFLDGMNIFIRYFMANQAVSTKSEPVGGVIGFLQFVDMIVYRFSPSKLIVVWESGGSCPRRKKIFPAYKENRTKIRAPSENDSMSGILKNDVQNKTEQLSMLYNILKHTPVCQIFIKDTECDDIIGYLAKYAFATENRTKIIASNDKDFYQLLEDKSVMIYDPARKITLDHLYVKEKFGISARNFCLARTLCGDPSDNIDGVPGIGLKTVCKRFPDFSDEDRDLTIDDVLNASKSLLESKSGAKLKAPADILQSEELIRRNWKLMYLSSNNFSASQIEKINGALEQHEPMMDKVGIIKEMLKYGINISFDINSFSSHLKQNLLFD